MTIQMKNTGKRIDLIANRKPQSQRVLYELRDRLKRNQFILNDTNPDIVISIGGDGMLLSAFHKYEDQLDKVRFIGVHTGHLGFYTDYRDFELDKLVTNLQLDTGARVSYPVLNVKVFLENGEVTLSSFTPEDLGMEGYAIEDIRGGNAQENAEILLSVLKNEPSPFLETTVLNAGLGFYANGKVASIKEGVALARQVIASGKALEKLRLLQEYQK